MFKPLLTPVLFALRLPLLLKLPLLVLLLGQLYHYAPFAVWVNNTPMLTLEHPQTGEDILRLQPLQAACLLGQIAWIHLQALL